MKVEYYPTKSLAAAQVLLEKPGYDFVEGIMFNLNSIVVMHGTMVERAERKRVNYCKLILYLSYLSNYSVHYLIVFAFTDKLHKPMVQALVLQARRKHA